MTKSKCIQSLKEQGYTIKALDKNETKILRNWKDDLISDDVIENNYGVILNQDGQFVIDIDDPEFNEILKEYRDKTLVNQTGGNGRHYYFKDNVSRVEKYRIKTTKLYYGDKIIGDIKAKYGYVIGCGSIHENGKKYNQISTTNKVLELDGYDILKILKNNGVTIKNEVKKKIKFEEGLKEGERNDECFKVACNLFETQKLGFEAGLDFIQTWNKMSEIPLEDSEIKTIVESAWSRITNKEFQFDGTDKINNVVRALQEKHTFVTLRKTEETLLFNGKIYDRIQAETIIKEETEKLITNCTTHDRNEVVNKIKVQTYSDIENFDSDPNLVVVENGILNLNTLELKPHTPDHLSRVLLPVEYRKPKYEIKNETIFEDIEKNLKDTLFWKSLKNSFIVDGKFKKNGFETALEISASLIIKHHIDEKAIMFLGNGDNGKSVLLEYIKSMYGESNISNISLQNIADDKFMSADLDGMSANIFTDLGHNELRNTGKIKAIITNEGIQVQRKHQQGFKLKPFCKLIFSCNRFPKVYDQSQGFFRRWIIVKWERNFDGDPQRDEGLKQKLATNQDKKNLVFSCLVRLANKLNKVGKFSHTIDWKTIQKEWNENADPLDGFATNYIIDSENSKTKRETYQFYKEIMFEKGETPLGIAQFSRAFAEYYEEDRTSNNRVWLNIDFKRPIQTTLKETDSNE